VAEQRYKAILAAIAAGRTVSKVASDCGVCRRTMHGWSARYEQEGLREGGAEAMFPSSANANGVSLERRCTATAGPERSAARPQHHPVSARGDHLPLLGRRGCMNLHQLDLPGTARS
jgi:transposase-like protein